MNPLISNASDAVAWLRAQGIQRVEVVFADLTSVARGKVMDTASFAEALGAKMPSLLLGLTVTGGEPPDVFKRIFPPSFPDMALRPDWCTLVRCPLSRVPTATVVCNLDARFAAADGHADYDVAELSPRQLLQRTLARLEDAGYQALVAPELEFFLVHPERNAQGGLQVAHGMSGRVPHIESSHDLASAETAQTFALFFDDLWAACEMQAIPISGYGHATAQLLRLVSAGLKLSVCVDEVAASGGYMMAAVANEIIASPFAIIGSIGVISTMPNVTKLLDSLGVEVEDVTAGQYKRTMVPYKLSTPESRQKVQEDVDIYHAAFQEHILKCRGEKGIDVVKVATGETWFGDTALKLKLVDRIGTSDELLLSRLKAGKDVLLVRHRLERRSLFGEWAPVEAGEHAEGSLLLGADAQSLVDSAVLSLAKALTKLASLAPSASAKN